MPEPREPGSIIEAAKEAAAAGDYSTAEALLREAALVQESRLGPLHPDLANTLNNLGVVCEITGNLVEADRSFRRAYAIATTVLEPDHPFVTTSRKNLCDFCEAQGTPIELPASSPALMPTPEPPVTASVETPREPHVHSDPRHPQLAESRIFRRFAIGGLGPIAMLMVVLAAGLPRLTTEQAESSSVIAMGSAQDIPAQSDARLSVEPIPLHEEITETTGSGPDGENATHLTAASTPGRPTVVRAILCAELDDWRCDPADRPVPAGPLFFYTQVTSTSAITVEHRWYRDNVLNHSVELRVQASPTIGYRSYSRNIMNSDSAGSWRVELRTEDGVLLHEERFSVQ